MVGTFWLSQQHPWKHTEWKENECLLMAMRYRGGCHQWEVVALCVDDLHWMLSPPGPPQTCATCKASTAPQRPTGNLLETHRDPLQKGKEKYLPFCLQSHLSCTPTAYSTTYFEMAACYGREKGIRLGS